MSFRLVFMLVLAAMLVTPAYAGSSNIVSVSTLGIQGEGLPGVVNYILVQLDYVASQGGPTIQFNEVNLGGGSRVGEEWKEGARRAVRAVLHAVGDSGHDWMITIKNRSATSLTDGMSASAAVAVAIMAAYRGGAIRIGCGAIRPDHTRWSLRCGRWVTRENRGRCECALPSHRCPSGPSTHAGLDDLDGWCLSQEDLAHSSGHTG